MDGAGADAGLRVARLETTVDLIKSAAGADDRFLRCSLAGGATGIVIEAMGRGNLPPAMKPGIVAATAAGVPVVLSSRYGAGSVQERYGYEGGGHDLAQLGVIFAGRLNGLKARMKLMAALAYTRDDDALERSSRTREPGRVKEGAAFGPPRYTSADVVAEGDAEGTRGRHDIAVGGTFARPTMFSSGTPTISGGWKATIWSNFAVDQQLHRLAAEARGQRRGRSWSARRRAAGGRGRRCASPCR